MSVLRGSAFRRSLSAPRRLFNSGAPSDQSPKTLDEKVNLLHQSIKELDTKVERRFLIYASLQKLVEEKKAPNPFIQWSWQVGVVTLIVFAERWVDSDKENN